MVAPAAVVDNVTWGEATAWAAVMAYVLVWTAVVSEDVETAKLSPVEADVGFVTPLAVTSTVLEAAMVQPTVKVSVAPPLLVTAL